MSKQILNNPKLSKVLQSRLAQLDPDEVVEATILLANQVPRTEKRLNRKEKMQIAKWVRGEASVGLPAIDAILKDFGGRRVSKQPDALGSVAVVTTAAGIQALTGCQAVNTILENQSVFLDK